MKFEDILVLAVRHGETTLNAANKFRGNKNVSLNPTGRDQAKTIATKLSKLPPLGRILCSDRRRTEETAEIISEALDKSWRSTPKLRALNVGDFSGKDKNSANTDALEEYINHPNKKIPGGESLNQFRARVKPILKQAVKDGRSAGRPQVLVVHSSIIHEIGNLFAGDHKARLVHPGGMVAIYKSKSGGLEAKAVFKPKSVPSAKADTIS